MGDFPPGRVAAAATVAAGLLVAWAPAIPAPVRFPLLFLGLLAWAVGVGWAVAAALREAFRGPMAWTDRALTAVGIGGVAVAGLSAAQLGIIRLAGSRPALVWDVDWRFAWGHAQTIARFGGLDRALDYAGASVDYHVGPAWLAAAAHRILGFGMTEVLFGLVPLLGVLAVATGLFVILARAGISRRLAAAAVGVASCLPFGFQRYFLERLSRGVHANLVDADNWLFASGLMLNSYLALAVGVSATVLLVDHRRQLERMAWGVLGLASLAQLKPQFFLGFGALVGTLALGRVLRAPLFLPRSRALLVAGLGAVAVAMVGIVLMPGYELIFSAPSWSPGSGAYSLRQAGIELLLVPLLLITLAVRRPGGQGLGEILAGSLAAVILLVTALALFRFPVRPEVVASAAAVGMPFAAERGSQDLLQSLIPLRLVLAVGGIAVLASIWATARGRVARVATLAIAVLIVASPVPLIAHNFIHPLHAYEAAEDQDLFDLLRRVPREDAVLVASDLADPADDYSRNLRGFLLTAYGGHQLYLATVEYLHYRHQDAPRRLAELRTFFGTPWSEWHATWLDTNRITGVLVSDRCLPAWWEDPGIGLVRVGQEKKWTVLATDDRKARNAEQPGKWSPSEPKYGRSPCL